MHVLGFVPSGFRLFMYDDFTSTSIARCTDGAAVGEAVDESILRNRRCLACGQTFSVSRR